MENSFRSYESRELVLSSSYIPSIPVIISNSRYDT